MRGRWNWTRPEPRIYSYNTDPSSFSIGYSSSSAASSRSARASSVAVGSESQSVRNVRATTVAPASDSLTGYSGFYGKQLAQMSSQSSSMAKSSTAVSETTSRTVETQGSEKLTASSKKIDYMAEHNKSLEYGKSSRSAALRRAEVHAVNSGKDPRHVMVPRNLDDDICKKVADIHMIDDSSMSREGRIKVEKLEKELNALINSSMSYKSNYKMSAKIVRARLPPPARRSGRPW